MKSDRTFIRVTRQKPCPICKRPDWCSVDDDGSIIICMRVSNGSVSETKNGGYLHVLRDHQHPFRHQQPQAKPNAITIGQRHPVYSALLDMLPLSGKHADHLLLERGLSDFAIARNGYATWPTDEDRRRRICRELSARFNLEGIPGFYRQDGEWRMVGRLWAGFLIPSRDARGLITALSIRLDNPADGKYLWFSSRGALSPQPHFVRPWRVNTDREAILTEGVLKSDIIADLLDCTVIGLPGTAAFSDDLGEQIRAELPNVERIAIAYDADFQTKPQVLQQLTRLREVLLNSRFQIDRLTWPPEEGKGFDDYLLGRGAR
jgi:DNA primase